MMRPGIMRSVICFRHTFLRPINSDDPDQRLLGVSDFPRKLTFGDFEGWRQPSLTYRPENTGHWRIDDFEYANASAEDVSVGLRKLCKTVENRVLPWVRSLTEAGELAQIKSYGEDAWCEKRWIEDYETFLSRTPG